MQGWLLSWPCYSQQLPVSVAFLSKLVYESNMNNYDRLDSMKAKNQPMGKMLEDFMANPNQMSEETLRFTLTFTVSDEDGRTVQLCEAGEEREVNPSSLEEYVKLFNDYYLDTSIKKKFKAFKAGFGE